MRIWILKVKLENWNYENMNFESWINNNNKDKILKVELIIIIISIRDNSNNNNKILKVELIIIIDFEIIIRYWNNNNNNILK